MDASRLATSVLDALLHASLAGSFAVALVWLLCHHLRLPARWQVLLWWMVSFKLLLVLAGMPAISIPVLPAPSAVPHDPAAPPRTARTPYGPERAQPLTPTFEAPPNNEASGAGTLAAVGAILLWVGGIAWCGLGLLRSRRNLRRLMEEASPGGAQLVTLVRDAARRAGVHRVPLVLVSARVKTPQTIGALRPAILLPAAALAAWTPGELQMALCHELAHVRRRDLLWGWVPLLAESLFFFHPLVRIAAREYLVAREAACDAAAIDAAEASPDAYGRLLVRLGIDSGGSAFAAGGASGSRSVLARRLNMLVRAPRHLGRSGRMALAAMTVLALVPLQLTARQAEPARPVTAAPAVPVVTPVPVTAAPAVSARTPRPARMVVRQPVPTASAARAAAAQAAREGEPQPTTEAARRADVEAAARAIASAAREARARALTSDRTRQQDIRSRAQALEQSHAAMQHAVEQVERAQVQERLNEAREMLRTVEQRVRVRAETQGADAQAEERRQRLQELAKELEVRRGVRQPTSTPQQALQQALHALDAELARLRTQQQALTEQQRAVEEAQRHVEEQLRRVRETLDAIQ